MSTVDTPHITLRTREIAFARGFVNPQQLRVAAGLTAWTSADTYMDGTNLRLHISILSRIMGALSCSLDDLVAIGPPDRIPPLNLGTPREWHKENTPATITIHVATRAQSMGMSARDLAQRSGNQMGPISRIWLGDWDVLDCRNTLPRLLTVLCCTKLSDLITIFPSYGPQEVRQEAQNTNMAVA